MKKMVLIFVAVLSFVLSNFSYAQESIKLIIDGVQINLDQPPVILNGRTLAPVAPVLNALNLSIKWDSISRTVTAKDNSNEIILTIDKNVAYVNNKKVFMDVPATVLNGRTLVPISFIANALGAKVSWDSVNRSVNIETLKNNLDGYLYDANLSPEENFQQSIKNMIFYKYDEFIKVNSQMEIKIDRTSVEKFETISYLSVSYTMKNTSGDPISEVPLKLHLSNGTSNSADGIFYRSILPNQTLSSTVTIRFENSLNPIFISINDSESIMGKEDIGQITKWKVQ